MRAFALSMGILLAAGGAAWAAESAPGSETTAAAQDDPGDRVVCKKKTKPNSRFTTKECHTVAEWEEIRETARKAFADVQNRPMVNISRDD